MPKLYIKNFSLSFYASKFPGDIYRDSSSLLRDDT